MNSAVKKLWVEALTSGEYRQAAGQLRRGEFFCCYGVLCDLHQKVTGNGKWINGLNGLTSATVITYQSGSETNFLLPIREVRQWAGLRLDGNPAVVGIRALSMDLEQHNDAGVPFAEIAAAVQEQL